MATNKCLASSMYQPLFCTNLIQGNSHNYYGANFQFQKSYITHGFLSPSKVGTLLYARQYWRCQMVTVRAGRHNAKKKKKICSQYQHFQQPAIETHTLFFIVTSAPFCSSSFTISLNPLMDAQNRAVRFSYRNKNYTGELNPLKPAKQSWAVNLISYSWHTIPWMWVLKYNVLCL